MTTLNSKITRGPFTLVISNVRVEAKAKECFNYVDPLVFMVKTEEPKSNEDEEEVSISLLKSESQFDRKKHRPLTVAQMVGLAWKYPHECLKAPVVTPTAKVKENGDNKYIAINVHQLPALETCRALPDNAWIAVRNI